MIGIGADRSALTGTHLIRSLNAGSRQELRPFFFSWRATSALSMSKSSHSTGSSLIEPLFLTESATSRVAHVKNVNDVATNLKEHPVAAAMPAVE